MLQSYLIQKSTKKQTVWLNKILSQNNTKAKATDPSSVVLVLKWKLCEALGEGIQWKSVTTASCGICLIQSYVDKSIVFANHGSTLCTATCVIRHLNSAWSQQTPASTVLSTKSKTVVLSNYFGWSNSSAKAENGSEWKGNGLDRPLWQVWQFSCHIWIGGMDTESQTHRGHRFFFYIFQIELYWQINLTLRCLCGNLTGVSTVTASTLQCHSYAHTRMTHFHISELEQLTVNKGMIDDVPLDAQTLIFKACKCLLPSSCNIQFGASNINTDISGRCDYGQHHADPHLASGSGAKTNLLDLKMFNLSKHLQLCTSVRLPQCRDPGAERHSGGK